MQELPSSRFTCFWEVPTALILNLADFIRLFRKPRQPATQRTREGHTGFEIHCSCKQVLLHFRLTDNTSLISRARLEPIYITMLQTYVIHIFLDAGGNIPGEGCWGFCVWIGLVKRNSHTVDSGNRQKNRWIYSFGKFSNIILEFLFLLPHFF